MQYSISCAVWIAACEEQHASKQPVNAVGWDLHSSKNGLLEGVRGGGRAVSHLHALPSPPGQARSTSTAGFCSTTCCPNQQNEPLGLIIAKMSTEDPIVVYEGGGGATTSGSPSPARAQQSRASTKPNKNISPYLDPSNGRASSPQKSPKQSKGGGHVSTIKSLGLLHDLQVRSTSSVCQLGRT